MTPAIDQITELRRGPSGRRERPMAIRGLHAIVRAEDGWRLSEPGDSGDEATGKFCLHCMSWQPIAEYYADRAKADGLGAYCKEAMKARATGAATLARLVVGR